MNLGKFQWPNPVLWTLGRIIRMGEVGVTIPLTMAPNYSGQWIILICLDTWSVVDCTSHFSVNGATQLQVLFFHHELYRYTGCLFWNHNSSPWEIGPIYRCNGDGDSTFATLNNQRVSRIQREICRILKWSYHIVFYATFSVDMPWKFGLKTNLSFSGR